MIEAGSGSHTARFLSQLPSPQTAWPPASCLAWVSSVSSDVKGVPK